jgi:hypothetical protein
MWFAVWGRERLLRMLPTSGFIYSLFDGSQNSLSPGLGLWRFALDSAVFLVQIVNDIVVVVESVVVHVVVLQEAWSWDRISGKPKESTRTTSDTLPHPVFVENGLLGLEGIVLRHFVVLRDFTEFMIIHDCR